MAECIQVVVRCRPFNKKEKSENRLGIISMDLAACQISIANPDNPEAPPKNFTFDAVYDENTIQRTFYEESCFGLIENVLEGFNGTIFAYGQTGCGENNEMTNSTFAFYLIFAFLVYKLQGKLSPCKARQVSQS